MERIGIIEIDKQEKKVLSELLEEIEFEDTSEEMQERIERLNAKEDDEISIGGYEYDNGYYMSCMLCSGVSNYYENYVLYDENGNEIWYNDLCDYMIEDFSVETENGDIYGIRFKEV